MSHNACIIYVCITRILSKDILHLDVRAVGLHEGVLNRLQAQLLVLLQPVVEVGEEGQCVVGLALRLDVVEGAVEGHAEVVVARLLEAGGNLENKLQAALCVF